MGNTLRGLKKNCAGRGKNWREAFVARDDPVQGIYENVRCEALENSEPASWALERVRRYGVASLLPGGQPDFPFILCAQSVPRAAWSGTRDFHREKLLEVYEFLTQEVMEDASGHLRPRFQREAGEGTYDCSQLEALRNYAAQNGMEIGCSRGLPGRSMPLVSSCRDRRTAS
jgi:hypothetical protein